MSLKIDVYRDLLIYHIDKRYSKKRNDNDVTNSGNSTHDNNRACEMSFEAYRDVWLRLIRLCFSCARVY